MKILFVSIPSIHAIRWIENLKEEKHEIYWFDIANRGNILIDENLKINKIISWKKRKIKYIKGEYLLQKKIPKIHNILEPYLEVTIQEKFESILEDIKPDLVHSFEMQTCSYPILNVMQKYPKITWVYSCWGSDLFYYQNFNFHKKKIKKILNRIQVLHTDCKRDYNLAKDLGFKGMHSGVIPGGTGYNLEELKKYKQPIDKRNIILVKGYENTFGRALNVLKALQLLDKNIEKYNVVIFAAHQKVIDFINNNKLPYKFIKKDALSHNQTLELMGKSKIYIGNSISDGVPNTLLEALVMDVFPIQSNPGNVTTEVIKDNLNGALINNPNDIKHIKRVIFDVLKENSKIDFNEAIKINTKITQKRLDANINKKKVIDFYNKIEDNYLV